MEVGGWRFVHIVPLIGSLILATINKQPNKTNEKNTIIFASFSSFEIDASFSSFEIDARS